MPDGDVVVTLFKRSSRRYLLCRARGGLNDTLCQVERCWSYAERHGRTLIIDTSESGLQGPFSAFFRPRRRSPRVLFQLESWLLPILNGLSCCPAAIAGRIDSYQQDLEWSNEANAMRLKGSKVPISFDFFQDHEADLLVHEQVGGGCDSFELLERIRLTEGLAARARRVLARLGSDYDAIHVRNTDYRTDSDALFERIRDQVAHRSLLVCSDDADLIQKARSFFPTSRILQSTETPDTGGKPLHLLSTFEDRQQVHRLAFDAVVDLLALANSRQLHVQHHAGGGISGFSRLALHLHAHPDVSAALLDQAWRLPRLTSWRLLHTYARLRRRLGSIRRRLARHR